MTRYLKGIIIMANVIALLAGAGALALASSSKGDKPQTLNFVPPPPGPTDQQLSLCQQISGFSREQCRDILGTISDPKKVQEFLEKQLVGAVGEGCNQVQPGTGSACEKIAEYAIQKLKDLYCLVNPQKIRDPWQKPGLMRVVNSVTDLRPGEIFLPASQLAVIENAGLGWGALKSMPFSPKSVGFNKGFAVESTVIAKDGTRIPVPITKSYINWVRHDRAAGFFMQWTGRARGSGKFVRTLHLGNAMLAAGLARKANDQDLRNGFKVGAIIISETNYARGSQQGVYFKVGHTVGC